jgi:N-ethylmaleimide reductase
VTRSLFEPCAIGPLQLRNRIAMAPMTRSRASDDGTPRALMAEYYEQRAEAGLIVSEGTNISAAGQGFLNTPGIFRAEHVAAWRPVVARARQRGAAFFMQLWHVGRIGHPANMAPGLHPVAPSAVAHPRTVVTPQGALPVPVPHALSRDEVRRTIEDYALAASRAVEAGCDGVEVHAANGYLPSQFLHATSNLRDDEYGGSIANRCRFLVEVAQACADAVGSLRVGIRVTPFSAFNGATSGDEPALYERLLQALDALDLGYLHAVRAEVSGNVTVQPAEGQRLADVLGFVRPRWRGFLVAAGDFTLAQANETLATQRADMIAFGRDFIANPDLVTRLRQNHPLAPRNPAEWYGSGAEGYTDYPRWAEPVRESAASMEPSR